MPFLLKLAPLRIFSVNGSSLGLQQWTTFKSYLSILYSEINSLPLSLEWPTILCLFFFTPIHLCQILWHPHLFTTAGSNLVSLCKSPPIHSLLHSNCFHPIITCITLNGSPAPWGLNFLDCKTKKWFQCSLTLLSFEVRCLWTSTLVQEFCRI